MGTRTEPMYGRVRAGSGTGTSSSARSGSCRSRDTDSFAAGRARRLLPGLARARPAGRPVLGPGRSQPAPRRRPRPGLAPRRLVRHPDPAPARRLPGAAGRRARRAPDGRAVAPRRDPLVPGGCPRRAGVDGPAPARHGATATAPSRRAGPDQGHGPRQVAPVARLAAAVDAAALAPDPRPRPRARAADRDEPAGAIPLRPRGPDAVGRRSAAPWRRRLRDDRKLERRPDVLTFTSEPLEADLEAIGSVSAEIFARASRPYFDLFVRVCDIDWRGRSRNVCDGPVRISPERFTPDGDGVYRVPVELWPTAYRFRKGHRLRVHVIQRRPSADRAQPRIWRGARDRHDPDPGRRRDPPRPGAPVSRRAACRADRRGHRAGSLTGSPPGADPDVRFRRGSALSGQRARRQSEARMAQAVTITGVAASAGDDALVEAARHDPRAFEALYLRHRVERVPVSAGARRR